MSLEKLERKIKTTRELREIVSTMKLLSSVSILQYEQAGAALEKYRRNLQTAFHALILKSGLPRITPSKAKPKYLMILVGSDNGMVGKFNQEIIKAAHQFLKQKGISTQQTQFIIVGKRLNMLISQNKWPVYARYGLSNSVKIVNTLAESIILNINTAMSREKISHVYVFFHQHIKNQPVSTESRQIFPINTKNMQNLKNKPWATNNIPLITLSPEKMFSALVREILLIAFSSLLNHSLAAEHWTRMTNMQNAEKNIDENLAELDKQYQQKRQEQITEELIDVVSGAAALKK